MGTISMCLVYAMWKVLDTGDHLLYDATRMNHP